MRHYFVTIAVAPILTLIRLFKNDKPAFHRLFMIRMTVTRYETYSCQSNPQKW